ncbi:glycoside hydrolase [Desulfuromonas soudanensis]|uniref:beta-fructofuranosidase n=1 Tax=Desulfuromonas soudanensis TaxID=1603606 RepID=A0A0M4D7A6_9BACT|nr:glycoside hydrolase 100 family protein [Desulfuromonas soudanensis]ALC15330.1 glycoside hydrolase [Desulfuromonas soudanensis]
MNQTLRAPSLDRPLIDACYLQALTLLRRNATPAGILAASRTESARARNYDTIFGRDAAICALGMAASKEPDLISCARAGLLTLGRRQAANGQIANFVRPDSGEVDFWYTGCIDATLWWLIALHSFDERVPGSDLGAQLAPQIEGSLRWLACQEHPAWGLLQQNEASDWADIMPRSGFVLYTNALWFRVKELYGLAGAGQTRQSAGELFYPFAETLPTSQRMRRMTDNIREGMPPSPFFLSFVNFTSWGLEADLLANTLALLTGLADPSHGERIVSAVIEGGAHRPYPLRVVGTPIEPGDPHWRPYMLRHEQNLPWQYHNGGSWPFAGAFWILALDRLGKREEAWEELEVLALANQVNDWEFNEWFHGTSGAPMGMAGQSWNAAMFLLAYHTLTDRTPRMT